MLKKQNSVQKHSFFELLPVLFLQWSVLINITAEGNTRVNFIFMYWRSNRSGFVLLKVLMSPVSVGSSFLVVCLVSYPAAAAAAAGPDQGRSSLCHDRQTDLQWEIKRAKEGERNFCSFLLAVIIIQTDFSPPKKILYDNDLGSDIVVLQKHK